MYEVLPDQLKGGCDDGGGTDGQTHRMFLRSMRSLQLFGARWIKPHILAAVAEHETEMISKRTKDALAAAKARGQRLGNPSPAPSAAQARAVAEAQLDTYRQGVRPVITELHSQGLGLSAIAREMNRRGIKTARDRQWEPATVRLYVPTESAV